MPAITPGQQKDRIEALEQLVEQFCEFGRQTAEVLAYELDMDHKDKTLPPLVCYGEQHGSLMMPVCAQQQKEQKGKAGGEKYRYEKVFFKFARDDKGYYDR